MSDKDGSETAGAGEGQGRHRGPAAERQGVEENVGTRPAGRHRRNSGSSSTEKSTAAAA